MYLTGAAESFIYQRYFTHFTPQTLAMVRETTSEESAGFLKLCFSSPKLWWTLLWWSVLLLAHIALHTFTKKITAGKWVRRIIVSITAISLIWWIPARVETCRFLLLDNTSEAERIDNTIFYSTPWRVVYAAKFEMLAQNEMHTLAHNMEHMDVETSESGIPYIYFVIGESYNKHHSAVYGYELPTTPFQTQSEKDSIMVAMRNAVTPWNVTSMVFKQMFSTRSSDEDAQWTDGVLFPALMRKAGYTVTFLTNQFYKSNRQTSTDYNGSFFLNKQPFDSLCFDVRNKKHYLYDGGMLKELCQEPTPEKQFVIIHLLGQHQPYADRIPKGKAQFKASDIKRKDLSREERQTVADYDNATLINDQFLKMLYDRIASKKAIIVYVADHGEEVYDGNIGMFGRNHTAEPTPQIMRAEFEVPLEVFVTPSLQQAQSELMTQLRNAIDKPVAIDDLPHTLLKMAGIKNYYNSQRDFMSNDFKPRPRRIKGLKTTYDEIIKR